MATKLKNKSITNVFGSVAAAQTMVEQFPFSFGASEGGFTCSFDLLTALFNMCSDKPLDEMIVEQLTEKIGDSNCTWLQGIEETVKMAIETNITSLLTCEMSPIIPDELIGGGEFLSGSNNALPFSSAGITIPVSTLDFTGILKHCPSDETSVIARSNYMSCYDSATIGTNNPQLLTANELWKHDDFNAFLWFVKNKGVYGNLYERGKLMWDNRYKTKPYTKYERKPETFFTKSTEYDNSFKGDIGVVPFDYSYLQIYNNSNNTQYKKKQILECRYIDGDGIQSDAFQFRLAASNYYKTRKLTGENDNSTILKINKTIFEFNHEFLMSLKLYDAKTYLSQVTQNVFGQGNFSMNFSLTKEEEVIDEMLNQIIEKVINSDDTEIDDCFFNFSNEEYDDMINNSIQKRRVSNKNEEIINSILDNIEQLDKVVGIAASEEETKTKISHELTTVCQSLINGDNTVQSNQGWKFNYNYQFELIRMLVYPLVRPLFSPKVMTVILINTYIMGNPLKIGEKMVTFDDITPFFMNILASVVKAIKNMIVEMLYSWVIEKLTPLLTLFSLRIVMEQLEAYKKLVQDMLIACMGAYKQLNFGGNKRKGSGIDEVNYVDIDPELEKIKQTPVSNTNC